MPSPSSIFPSPKSLAPGWSTGRCRKSIKCWEPERKNSETMKAVPCSMMLCPPAAKKAAQHKGVMVSRRFLAKNEAKNINTKKIPERAQSGSGMCSTKTYLITTSKVFHGFSIANYQPPAESSHTVSLVKYTKTPKHTTSRNATCDAMAGTLHIQEVGSLVTSTPPEQSLKSISFGTVG